MAQNASEEVDLNVRIIQAVECCPLLYKGHATIEERQAVWQQISEELRVSESVLKSRWHILCGYYQRSLEKRRSTDEEGNDDGTTRTDFRYEREMAFMMPYMHARIAIAAANAARKQQELAAAGNKELTDPEFIITEKDLENATRLNNNLSDEYIFYDVETLDGEAQHYQQHQSHMDGSIEEDEDVHEQHIAQNVHEEIEGEVIEEVDESGNIVVQDLIIEGGELVSEDGEQIVVEDEEVLQMDDQIETVIEEVVDNTSSIEDMREHTETPPSPEELVPQAVIIQDSGARRILRLQAGSNGHKFAKIVQETTSSSSSSMSGSTLIHVNRDIQHQNDQQIVQSSPSFAPEYAVMTRRRRAVVLKATPRVQVELTDNAAVNAATNALELHEDNEGAALDVGAHAVVVDDDCHKAKNTTKDIAAIRHYEELQHHQNQQQIQQQQQQQHQIALTERHTGSSLDTYNSDYDNRSNDSNVVTTTAAENDDDHTTKGERSEDTIFGELVTAMLKHMPQERKRAIKKSIMDILLT